MRLLINGRSVTLASDPEIDAITEDRLEIRGGDTIEFRNTELDQTPPAGRYRVRVEDDEYMIQRATFPDGKTEDEHWTTYDTFLTINKVGVTVDLDQDYQIKLMEQLYQESKDMAELLEAVFE